VISALAWKEYREQRLIWAALALLAAPLIWGLSQLLAPTGGVSGPGDIHSLEGGQVLGIVVAALGIAGTYGLVCAAMLTAGEREAGTHYFVETLSGWRTRLWVAKLLIGAVFALGLALVLTGGVAALGFAEVLGSPLGWFGALAAVSLEALAWAMLGGVVCRSVLPAVALSAVLVGISWTLNGSVTWPLAPGVVVKRAGWALAALAGSALVFGRTDLGRLAATNRFLRTRALASRNPARWSLFWLCWRQGRVVVSILAAAGLVVGFALPYAVLVIWPVATLLLGVVCGTAVFVGEQGEGSYRFLADQRFPSGRVWTAKVLFWLGVGVGVLVLMILGARIVYAIDRLQPSPKWDAYSEHRDILELLFGRSSVIGAMGHRTFLTLWLAYGFSIGQFFALAVRKGIVGLMLSFCFSFLLAALWVPSLIRGGLPAWRVFVIPVVFLAGSRLAVWAWICQRLKGWKPAAGLVGCGVLAVGWLGGNLWYRVAEVPAGDLPFDVKAFRDSYPTPEQNRAGRLIRRALREFHDLEKQVTKKLLPAAKWVDLIERPGAGEGPVKIPTYFEQAHEVLERGWLEKEEDLGPWLDEIFKGKWARHLRDAAALPLGVLIDPRNLQIDSRLGSPDPLDGCRQMGLLLAARALQLQAQGKSAAGLDHLRVALCLARNMQNRAVAILLIVGRAVERLALRGLELWLTKVGPRPRLLRRALNVLTRHEAQIPPRSDSIKAEYLIFLNTFNDPAKWTDLTFGSGNSEGWVEKWEALLTTFSWQVPWERQRAFRVINFLELSRELAEASTPYWKLFTLQENEEDDVELNQTESPFDRAVVDPIYESRLRTGTFFVFRPEKEALALCRVRAARLQLALALYQSEKGKPARKLSDLVPRYLPTLPVDPFSGKSFRYRVSPGESMEWRAPEGEGPPVFRKVRPGQGILWSTGPDLIDDGGKKQGLDAEQDREIRFEEGCDLIFLLPRMEKP
jgi:hypothetical protein